MKNLGLMLACLLAGGAGVFAQQTVLLDDAISTGAREIEADLKTGLKIVVLNFKSPSNRFSEYVLDELMTALVKGKKIVVVDRANLDLIQNEMKFQMSGEVSDRSAQAIGQKLGAQSIVSGSMEDMGDFYRIRFRTIEVVSAAIQSLTVLNVGKDAQVNALMKKKKLSAGEYEHGLNFSTGRKIGAGFQNILFGWGSFSMGDVTGGGILALEGVVSFGVLIPGIITGIDGVWILGLVFFSLDAMLSFMRPFVYDRELAIKNGTYTAQEKNPMKHIAVAVVPDNKQNPALGLVYRTAW